MKALFSCMVLVFSLVWFVFADRIIAPPMNRQEYPIIVAVETPLYTNDIFLFSWFLLLVSVIFFLAVFVKKQYSKKQLQIMFLIRIVTFLTTVYFIFGEIDISNTLRTEAIKIATILLMCICILHIMSLMFLYSRYRQNIIAKPTLDVPVDTIVKS